MSNTEAGENYLMATLTGYNGSGFDSTFDFIYFGGHESPIQSHNVSVLLVNVQLKVKCDDECKGYILIVLLSC